MALEIRFKPLGIVFLLGLIVASSAFGIVGWTSRPEGGKTVYGDGSGEVLVLTNSATQSWLQEQAFRFNDQHAGRIHVTVQESESNRAVGEILGATARPALWASSPAWIKPLNSAWAARHDGKALITSEDSDDNGAPSLRSPLVFVTTRKKAAYLQPLLGDKGAWVALRELSMGQRTPPWGRFHFAYADPLRTDSGFMTLGMIVSDYSARNRLTGKLEDLSRDPRFLQYLGEVDRRLVCDAATRKSAAAALDTLRTDPERYDVVAATESEALDALAAQPNLVAIYPDPTCVVEQRVCRLDGADWLTADQQAAARTFLRFLSEPESVKASVKSHFRPVAADADGLIAETLSVFGSRGYLQTYASVDLPPFPAITHAAEGWRKVTPGADADLALADTPDATASL